MSDNLNRMRLDLHTLRQQIGICEGKGTNVPMAEMPISRASTTVQQAPCRRNRRRCVHRKTKLKAKKTKRQIRHDVKLTVSKAASTQTIEPYMCLPMNLSVDFIFQKYMESVKRKERLKLKMKELIQILPEDGRFSAMFDFLSDNKLSTKKGRDEVDPYSFKRHLLHNYLPNRERDMASHFHPMTLE